MRRKAERTFAVVEQGHTLSLTRNRFRVHKVHAFFVLYSKGRHE
jgi:hypothetical protein